MSGWGKYALAGLAAAVLTHLAVVHVAPRWLMQRAFERLSEARGVNAWTLAPRVTPASRTIVRPSPDFAYSACAYDLAQGPIALKVEPWPSYWSLSLYAANSDNYFVVDDREARHGVEIVLALRGQRTPRGATAVESPSRRGVALIRRLAPTVDSYAAAARAAQGDVCGGALD